MYSMEEENGQPFETEPVSSAQSHILAGKKIYISSARVSGLKTVETRTPTGRDFARREVVRKC